MRSSIRIGGRVIGRAAAIAGVAAACLVRFPEGAVDARAAEANTASAVQGLVSAERAFAAMSVERGMNEAFLKWLANESVLFRPMAVDGKGVWRDRPRLPATLTWEPSYAEIAGSGDFGVTTGPWELRPDPDSTGTPPAPDKIGHGQFLSVWRKQSDGEWRVVVDIGVSHAAPDSKAVGSGRLALGPSHPVRPASASRPRADLAAVERLWATEVRKLGHDGFDRWGSADLRVLREGEKPILGRDQVIVAYAATPDFQRIHPAGSATAASDDLGYTYGVIERRDAARRGGYADSSAYVRIWRKERDGKWRIALAVENALHRVR